MFMNKKGFELSLNMVVIVVLALVFLGVGITFIKKVGYDLRDQIPKIIPPTQALWQPTADNPVMFSPSKLDIDRGESKDLILQVYNYGASEVMCNLAFTKSHGPGELEFIYDETNRAIPIGSVGQWGVRVRAQRISAQESYLYLANVDCSQFTKRSDLFIDVK